jgi:hypothetical protein
MKETNRSMRELIRHTLAALAYRGGKAIRDAPPAFAAFRAGEVSRTPTEILAHIGDLLDWALRLAKGESHWEDAKPLPWAKEVARFFASLAQLEGYLASKEPCSTTCEKLFQGPIADALTHVGQLTMLRRLAGSPILGENYFLADIVASRVGPQQSPARREFA